MTTQVLVQISLTYTCSLLFKSPCYQDICIDKPVDAVLQAVLSLSIQTVAGLPQGIDASLAILNVVWAANSRRVFLW